MFDIMQEVIETKQHTNKLDGMCILLNGDHFIQCHGRTFGSGRDVSIKTTWTAVKGDHSTICDSDSLRSILNLQGSNVIKHVTQAQLDLALL
jgi:hypothetical protein